MILGAPHLLPLLWLVPVLGILALFAGWWRGRRLEAWAETALWTQLAPSRSGWRRGMRFALALIAVGFALMAAARPQVDAKLVQVERRGIDVLFALDVSLSMEATDVIPNRLDRSKQEIRELFDDLRGDRVGILIFSGSAFLLCPLTLDVAAANLFLDAASVDVLPDPGTNLESALRGAARAFEKTEGTGARAVILFTDGEGHEGDPETAARELREAGIPVFTVGVGTPNGEPIPVFDANGRHTGYKKDRSGNVVLSRLNETLLRNVASSSGGEYVPATLQGREVETLLGNLKRLEQGDLGGSIRRRVQERFQIPARIAALFLVLSFLIPEARRQPADRDLPEGGRA